MVCFGRQDVGPLQAGSWEGWAPGRELARKREGEAGKNGAEWSRIDPQGSQGYSGRCSFSNRAMRN